MTFIDASVGRVLVNERHLSADIDGWEVSAQRNFSVVTSILDTGTRWVPGTRTCAIGCTGMHNADVGAIHDEISSAIGVDNGLIWTVFPDGFGIGKPALMCVSELADYKITSKVDSAVAVAIDGQPDDGIDIGTTLHAHGAETADVNSTGQDNTAATTNGGVGVLHVTAYTGFTSAVIKVQHSADNSAWSDLATFTTVTAVTSQRVLVAAGTTVNRYVRSFLDVTGSGSVAFALSFARR